MDQWLSRINALPENIVSSVQNKISARKKAERQEKEKEQARLRLEEQRRVEERRQNALKLAFTRGHNPKRGNEQWEAWHDGRLYILRRENLYEISEGEVPVEKRFDLVPGRIVLVQRI